MEKEQVSRVLEKAFHAIAPEIEYQKINQKEPLRSQVEIDSLDFYRMMVFIHQLTGVSVPDSKLRDLQNLEELIDYISEQPIRHQPQSPGL